MRSCAAAFLALHSAAMWQRQNVAVPCTDAPCHVPPAQILVGNKSDMADEKRAVPYAKGKALADEYKIQFFETSAKDNTNVEEVGRCSCSCACTFWCV